MLTECTLDQPPSPSARSHRTSTSSATTPTAVNLDQFTSSVGCKVHQLDSREVLEAAFQNAISQNSLNGKQLLIPVKFNSLFHPPVFAYLSCMRLACFFKQSNLKQSEKNSQKIYQYPKNKIPKNNNPKKSTFDCVR